MHNPDSPVAYLDQASMNRIADKHALDRYLRNLGGDSKEDHNFRFLVNPELKKALRTMISKFSKKDQKILFLRYWDDQDISEIAASLNMTEKAVNERLIEILSILRERILSLTSGNTKRNKHRRNVCHE